MEDTVLIIIFALAVLAVLVVAISLLIWTIRGIASRIISAVGTCLRKFGRVKRIEQVPSAVVTTEEAANGSHVKRNDSRQSKRINAREFRSDLLSPMTDLEIIQKYRIPSINALDALIKKAQDRGIVNAEDLRFRAFAADWRTGKVPSELEEKYELLRGTLQNFVSRTIEKGFLEQSEVDKLIVPLQLPASGTEHPEKLSMSLGALKRGGPYLLISALALWWSFWGALFILMVYLAIHLEIIRDIVTIVRDGEDCVNTSETRPRTIRGMFTMQIAAMVKDLVRGIKLLFGSELSSPDAMRSLLSNFSKYRAFGALVVGMFMLYLLSSLISSISAPVSLFPDEFALLKPFDPVREAEALEKKGEYCEALEYLEYCREYHSSENDLEIEECYQRIKAHRESWWFRSKDFSDGIWRGKGACLESLVSASASDFFVVGDLRDLCWEGNKFLTGKDIDQFTVALAGLGVGLTAGTIFTGGGVAPFKGSASFLKVAHKLRKIPRGLEKELIAILNKCKETRSLNAFAPILKTLKALIGNPSLKTRDVMALISKSKSIDDLKRMERIAAAYGARTGKFMRLGGDDSIKAFERFGKNRQLPEALNRALQFGPNGTKLLMKHGPETFLQRLAKAKAGGPKSHSEVLGLNLSRLGKSKPGPNHHAHHIVAFDHPKAGESRAILKRMGVNLDSANNGAWLHKSFHFKLHTNRYFDEVNRRLRQAKSKNEALEVLDRIRNDLTKGSFPF